MTGNRVLVKAEGCADDKRARAYGRRVADRFTASDDGKILEQENHFDPRDVTNAGWQDA